MATGIGNGRRARVFIVGGGFAGIQAAKALAKADVEVTLIDRRNHFVFQPLLYQVATASLSPADISAPIRTILRGQKNLRVVLAEITGVDVEKKQIAFDGGAVEYDYLILAAGATHSYFGKEAQWGHVAPGLKSLEDATELRRRILLAFETAEYEGDAEKRKAALTFAIVGAGPTGVELAGAIKEIAGQTIPEDYKNVDTRTTRVILLEGMDRVLPPFPKELSERAKRDLEKMGVEVKLKAMVTEIDREGVTVGDEFIPVHNVFWAAGVKASPLGKSLAVPVDKAGRVVVNGDLSIPGHPEVFVTGDMAAAKSADTGKPVPGVAQGGIQMGRYAGKLIAAEVAGQTDARKKAFSYWDKGNMATIGKAKAVAEIGKFKFGGLIAWLLWSGVHIVFLVNFRNRIQVLLSWFWNWFFNIRDARLITGPAKLEIQGQLPEALARSSPRVAAPPPAPRGSEQSGSLRVAAQG